MFNKRVFAAMILGLSLSAMEASAGPETQAQTSKIEIPSLKPVHRVVPAYPDHLKDEGIAGEVAIMVMIGSKGNVRTASIFRGLHPELDAAALAAIRQWTFEPYMFGGEAVSIPAYLSIIFNPGSSGGTAETEARPPATEEPEPPESDELREALGRGGAYARRLAEAGPFAVCREEIVESLKTVREEETACVLTGVEEQYQAVARYSYPVLRGLQRNRHLNDYQLITRDGTLVEQRKSPGRAGGENPPGLSLRPMLEPSRLLDPERRPLFRYRLAGRERTGGRSAIVLEITPRRKEAGSIREGKIWLDGTTFQILRTETIADQLPGETRFREECARYHLTPHFRVTHVFNVEKKSLLYPGRSEIRLEYSGLVNPPKDAKAVIRIRYDRYRFFSVETEERIIKGIIPAAPESMGFHRQEISIGRIGTDLNRAKER